ncbi:DUF1648 domain-containing protein [Flavobacterium sp. UBA7680]|uniref:DUF1648 domain-containing protein n=1 Tax=Flavobacterium sp. UBA7680 TaxID=1946559 RepID=UPI0025BCB5A0|nr:DUF1648 domain-containing protein [Flavobacterium sp. UBA7680]
MKIKGNKNDKIWESIALLLLAINALIIAVTVPILPDIIPIHFDSTGKVDNYGSKYILWVLFVIAVFVYSLMTVISFNPGLYKSRMTGNNIEEQYRLTAKMTRTVKTFVNLFFVIVTVFVLQSVQGKDTEYSLYLFLLSFPLIMIPTLYYVVKLGKVR